MFGFGFGWGNQLAAVFSTILAVFLFALAFSVLVAVTFLLVRFLWVGTRAAQLYIALNGDALPRSRETAPATEASAPALQDEVAPDLFGDLDAAELSTSDTLTPQPPTVEETPPAKPVSTTRRSGPSRGTGRPASRRSAAPAVEAAPPEAPLPDETAPWDTGTADTGATATSTEGHPVDTGDPDRGAPGTGTLGVASTLGADGTVGADPAGTGTDEGGAPESVGSRAVSKPRTRTTKPRTRKAPPKL